MSRFARRHALAVMTFAALTSFPYAHAQHAAGAEPAFRDSPAWVLADGVLTKQEATESRGLVTRLSPADSITSFEYRAAPGVLTRSRLVVDRFFAMRTPTSRTRPRPRPG